LSAEQDKARSLAERIAGRLGESRAGGETTARVENATGDELAQLRATLRDLQQRLVQIESRVAGDHQATQSASSTQTEARAPQQFLSSTYVSATHPSLERFGVDDAVTELVDFFEKEKVCTVEPGGKPCDHCAMCSSRGF
jgi:hypothetical protein